MFHVEQIILPKGKIGNWFVPELLFSLAEINGFAE
jgi:hypothetical protein